MNAAIIDADTPVCDSSPAPTSAQQFKAMRAYLNRLTLRGFRFVSTGHTLLVHTPGTWRGESIDGWASAHKREILLALLAEDIKRAQDIGVTVEHLYHLRNIRRRGMA